MRRDGRDLTLGGSVFRVAGACCYYFAFASEADQIRILDLASDVGLNALRIWAFNDLAHAPRAGELCFQYFDDARSTPILHEGPDGLERLDRAVALSGARGMRLILTLANHHPHYGGLPQYSRWFGGAQPVYEDARVERAFRHYAQSLIGRRNTVNGLSYRSDPAILAWEIVNEPRSHGNARVITQWLDRMSRFVRECAPDQLIAAGDEGFLAAPGFPQWMVDGSSGVDAEAIANLPAIDIPTFHLYPDQWAPAEDPIAFGEAWIAAHAALAKRVGKPMLLEEFGLPESRGRDFAYGAWLEAAAEGGLAGTLAWMIGLPGQGDQYLLSNAAEAAAIVPRARRSISSVHRGRPAAG